MRHYLSWLAAILLLLCPSVSTAQNETGPGTVVLSWWPYAYPPPGSELEGLVNQRAGLLLKRVPLPENPSLHQTADEVRRFIDSHSVLKTDVEFYSYWSNIPYKMEMMTAHAAMATTALPHTACGGRSAIMDHVLKQAGIRSRSVVVYTNKPDKKDDTSHTYLEIFNPETGKWEIQDPTNDYFWIFKNTRMRASTEDLLSHPVAGTFLTCESEEECTEVKPDDDIVDYFALAAILDIEQGHATLLVNRKRFSDEKLQEYLGQIPGYCTVMGDPCIRNVIHLPVRQSKIEK